MALKVLIPAAGTGSRLGGLTQYINKALISIGNQPALSRIISRFPEDTEFVIAAGYRGELIREFISLAYPEKNIQIVDIYPYEGQGSGLGLSILKCRQFLQEPFIFCSCDTLVEGDIPAPDYDWMGYAHREHLEQYRTLHLLPDRQGKRVSEIREKNASLTNGTQELVPYIGLCGIYHHQVFWTAMETGGAQAVSEGEAYGLKAVLENFQVTAHLFTWHDTGVPAELEETRKQYRKPGAPNILEKEDEAIWFVNNRVIKFSNQRSFIENRVTRAEYLQQFVPKIIGDTPHMYSYAYVSGDVLSKCVSIPVFQKLLDFSQRFWVQKELAGEEKEMFYAACMRFYRDKTLQRVQMFYDKFERQDNVLVVNDVPQPTLKALLSRVDWGNIAHGLPGQFHGDYHFENILYNKVTGEFKYLDWRQDFEKSLTIGDIYYDLAKLLHGLIICHELIAKDAFDVEWQDGYVHFDFERKNILVECEQYYYTWLYKNGYDVNKVKQMTALIFLNIAALHHYPYSLLLYALGKKMLHDVLGGDLHGLG